MRTDECRRSVSIPMSAEYLHRKEGGSVEVALPLPAIFNGDYGPRPTAR